MNRKSPPLIRRTIVVVVCSLVGSICVQTVSVGQKNEDYPDARRQLADFFNHYQAATGSESDEELQNVFDPERMVDEIVARAKVDAPAPMRQGLTTAISSRLAMQLKASMGTWYRHKIQRIKFFESGSEAEVFVRSWSDNQQNNRQIFWLHRKAGRWFIYDVADLSTNITFTTMGSMALRQVVQQDSLDESFMAMVQLSKAVVSMTKDDLAGASAAMEMTVGRPVPPYAESLRWFLHAVVAASYDSELSLEHLQKAAAFQPDFPLLDYMRAAAYNDLGRHESAAQHAQKYLDRFGGDADAYFELAFALDEQQQTSQAIVALQKALEDTPNSVECLSMLGRLLPAEQKQEIAGHFAQLRDPSDGFRYLADSFYDARDAQALEVLIQARKKIEAQEPLLTYHEAVALSLREKHDGAYQLAKDALKGFPANGDPNDRSRYEYLVVHEAILADRIIEHYRAAEHPQEAFRDIVDTAITLCFYDQVQPLVASHLKRYSDQSEAWKKAAELSYAQDDYVKADTQFAKAYELAKVASEQRNLLDMRIECWLQQEKPLEAYRQLPQKPHVFAELVYRLFFSDDEEQLQRLIDLHEKSHPESVTLARWSADLLFRQQKYADVVKRLETLKHPKPDQGDDDLEERYFNRAIDLQFRSLLRLGRLDEALVLAKKHDADTDFHQALAYASQKKLAPFRAAYRRCLEDGYTDEDFIVDDDFPEGFGGLNMESGDLNLSRVVLMSDKPYDVDSTDLIDAAKRALDIQLFQEQWDTLQTADDDYVCRLTENAFLLSIDGHKAFVHQSAQPYLGDANMLADEYLDDVGPAIRQHRACLSVDVIVWPKDPNADSNEPRTVPVRGAQLVGRLAAELAGDQTTVVFDPESTSLSLYSDDVAHALRISRPGVPTQDVVNETPAADQD